MSTELIDSLVSSFAKEANITRGKLIDQLLAAGFNPDYVLIGERLRYDETTQTMKYECFPMSKNVHTQD